MLPDAPSGFAPAVINKPGGGTQPAEATSVGQGATGNAYIDGLLIGSKWSGTVTFSFPDLGSRYSSPYASGENTTGFDQVSLQVREAARSILLGQNVFNERNVST